MQKKLITACLALVAFAAFAIAPALASASPVLTEDNNGVAVPVGTKIIATNTGDTLMTTSLGTIHCTKAVITGELVKNNGTEVEGTISSASFTGTGAEERCTTAFLGNIKVTPKRLPWCIKAKSSFTADTFQLTSGACPGGGIMEFTLDSSTVGECTYTKASVTGSFITGTGGDLTVSEQEFVKSAGSGFCPGSGKLDMTFDLYTDGKEHTAANQLNLS
jgi:hypothetical protein